MIDLDRHDSIQSALSEAFERFATELCLIEANRDRENARLTYAQVRAAAHALAGALGSCERGAILMTNQSKWHIAACALFHLGAVVVPLDPKLTPEEHEKLLEHSGADTLVVEAHLWRELRFAGRAVVAEAPPAADLRGALRFEELRGEAPPEFVPRGRTDPACIVYSSGTGGRPKGCVMTHGNYLAQCDALTRLYAFQPGDRYLSILPTNHAIDFMVGFFGAYVCGATVIHLRSLRPEFVRAAFPRYGIAYMALVPMVLKNLEQGLRERMASQPAPKRLVLNALRALNRLLSGGRPRPRLGRLLLRPLHVAFGGRLKALFVGGAFTDPATLRFFADLGIPVANGYGLTEAGTVVTLNDFADYRPDTVGRPLPGTEVRILDPGPDGVGEVAVRGPTVMAGYWADPELTAETIVDGWLHTGDLGRIDATGHLTLFGRRKNMVVTAGGKNVYPEDVENAFEGLAVAEYCIFAAHVLWPGRDERLLLVVRPRAGEPADRGEIERSNRALPEYKRVRGYLVWPRPFPRTASLKIKRQALCAELAGTDPAEVVEL